MNLKHLVFVFLCFNTIFTYGQSKGSSIDLGKKKYNAGDYKGAIVAYTKAIQADPSNALAYY